MCGCGYSRTENSYNPDPTFVYVEVSTDGSSSSLLPGQLATCFANCDVCYLDDVCDSCATGFHASLEADVCYLDKTSI